ncbi:hypothetical protein M408DRAFT_308877 [Serendipita vermifera MAFF 305830]|uniref:NB-ARC domain-containing protein n=1 Tax=Serendipita vermifera MAFF 305830 TaxID=933852 RepID=A0A0C3AJK7_SERVB|nr:hypothetical protein M408DRAFT_308877 [Serendipita vermifera MAFF 305830]
MAVQKISGKIVSDVAVGSRVFAKSLPTVSPYFVGRELELDLMKTHLVKSTHSGQKVFAITGMGGSGKTQLVSYFLQETNKEQILFTRVVFIDASSESTLKTDLQSWAQSLGFGHEQDDWSSALSFLASGISDGRWFLIYDNADDPNLRLKKYFPGCTKGTILITSRNRGVRDLTNTYHLELGKMGADDALAALEKAAYRRIPNPSKEMDDTKILMEKLGYLPLALVHAGSYCHQQSSIVDGQAYDFTISRYLTLFNKRRDALLGSKNMFTQEEYERGVYATLDLSYEVIQEASRQFLQIISHFQYSEIHLAMFQTAAQAGFKDSETYFPRPDEHNLVWSQLNDLLCIDGEPDEFQLLELIRDLQSFSLILRSESSLRMHPLVQAWARDMKLAETKNYEAMAAQILSSCSRDGNAYIYRYLLPHIKERLAKMEGDDLHINDKVAFGRVFDEVGAFTLAEPLFKQAITGYGEETNDTLKVVCYLAQSIRNQGRWEEAETLEKAVLEKRQRILGIDHPDSISAAAALAMTYSKQGRWNEAEKLEVEVLEKRNRLLGADHPSSIDAMANLASTYSNQGRWKEAEQLQEEVLEKRIRILGADHPSSITAAASLASTYREKGRCNDAEKFEIEVPEQRNRILGVDHPDSMTAAANLAKTYRNQGRWKEAESLQEEVLENRKRVLGADHYKSIAAAAGLAVTYESQGRLKDAERVLESVVKQSVNILGPQRPHTQRRVRRMVDICTKLGKQDKAREVENYLL